MTSARMRLLGGFHEAVSPGVGPGGRAVHLLDLAVLVPLAEPVPEVPVEFAARDAALATVDLALDAEALQLVLAGGLGLGVRVHEGSGAAPRPLDVVGARVPTGQRDDAVLALVDVVQLGVRQAEARAVDGVEEVEDGVVQLGGEIEQSHA